MKNPCELNIASFSDVHLGHPKNETPWITKNLMQAFPMNHETSKLDIIAIGGDFYDTMLNLPDDSVVDADVIIIYFLRLCKKYDITLIVLEGTPSHDRGQPKRFVHLNEILSIGADLHYFDKITVHHFEKFGIDVLFVPDKATPTVERTLAQVKEKLIERGLEKVDYAWVHCTFKHHLPEYVKTEKHDTDAYIALVRYLIFGAHIHQSSRYGIFITHGSFDRIAHGEEEPKGHYRVRVRSETDMDVRFIENTNARVFRTIDCSNIPVVDAMEYIAKSLLKVPDNSFIRVVAEPGSALLNSLLTFEKKWPTFNWSTTATKTKEEEIEENTITQQDEGESIHIDSSNIASLVQQKLAQNAVDAVIAKRSLELLQRIR